MDRIDLSAFEARYRNEAVGASAYHPRVLLKIVLLAYARAVTSSRVIESLCCRDVQFMAVSGDSRPQFTTIAGFIACSSQAIAGLFTEVVLVCSRQVVFFTGKLDAQADAPAEAMKAKIDSAFGKQMITRRFATVEPVYGNIRHKRLNRFTLRGKRKVDGRNRARCNTAKASVPS